MTEKATPVPAGATLSDQGVTESAQSLSSFLTALQGLVTQWKAEHRSTAGASFNAEIKSHWLLKCADDLSALLAGVPEPPVRLTEDDAKWTDEDRQCPEGAAPGAPDVRGIIETLGFDPTNHHNALGCPYCNPDKLACVPPPGAAANKEKDTRMEQTPTENTDPRYAAIGNLGFLMSVIRSGEQLSADEEACIRKTMQRLQDHMDALPSPPDGWQDISTAPKDDGVMILVREPKNNQIRLVVRHDAWAMWLSVPGRIPVRPTHWMPLPPPPPPRDAP